MPVIEVEELQKRFGQTTAVEDVSFSVEEGEIFGILGPNGAGKTTTVECVEGLTKRDGGDIRVLGLDPQKDRTGVRKILGAQLQTSRLPGKLRVIEALKLYASFYDDPADPEELLQSLGLEKKRNTFFDKLSGGQAQRLSIALALIGQPKVAILDELTTGLDPQARRATWDLIEQVRDSGVTIVLVSHFMEEAERLCDRLAVIDQGRVRAVDTPAGLISRVSGSKQLSFTPSQDFDHTALEELPGVSKVSSLNGSIVVSGEGDLLQSVNSTMSRLGVELQGLNMRQATLEDAFTLLTSAKKDDQETEEAR